MATPVFKSLDICQLIPHEKKLLCFKKNKTNSWKEQWSQRTTTYQVLHDKSSLLQWSWVAAAFDYARALPPKHGKCRENRPRDLQFAGTIAQIVHKPKFEFKQQIRNHCALESGVCKEIGVGFSGLRQLYEKNLFMKFLLKFWNWCKILQEIKN